MKGALGKTIFNDFLGPALASGRLVPAPQPLLAGRSLEALPDALALLRRGISASKIVASGEGQLEMSATTRC